MATNDAEYQRNHKRVRKVRGKVKDYNCKCGRQARDWAHKHNTNPADPNNYEPMCRFCHKEYDRPEWLQEERRQEQARIENTNAFKGWTPERREAQRQRMLEKWSSKEERDKQAERARRDKPWRGRRPQGGDAG